MTFFVATSTTKMCGYSPSVSQRSQKRNRRFSVTRAFTLFFSRASTAFFVASGDSAPATTWETKARRVPSGNHFGPETPSGISVRRSGSPPSTGMT